jgi:type III pantothenate kinase
MQKTTFSHFENRLIVHFVSHEDVFLLIYFRDRYGSCSRAATISKCNRLVIDAGTCVTYDFIDQE